MTLYEFNKPAYASLPTMTKEQIEKDNTILELIRTFDSNNYFMLLNHDKRYYTLFAYKDHRSHYWYKMASEIKEVAQELGEIKAIERNGQMVEIWIGADMYALFPYQDGVIEI